MLETKVMFNATEITVKVSVWARGDPFPAIGHAVGIDTETELITDAELTPPLVVLGVFNPADMTCYQIAWTDAQYFMQELLKRDCKLYFANAGFDYFELESDELRDAVSNDRLVDLLIRAPLKEIATIGYIRTHSLKDACQWHLNYEMDKHEDEGDQAARVTFRRNKDITDEQRIYLAIDCASTYYACEAIGPQATECTHTRGQIVLYHISKNGFPYDPYMFDYCEKLLQQHMDQYRAELITYGYPDPYKKDMPTDIKQLQDGWPMFRDAWFAAHIKEKYQFEDSLPGKSTVKRILLYGTAYMQHGTDKGTLARVFAALLLQDKNLSKKEQAAYDQLADEHDFLDACNGVGKKEVWPTLLVAWMRAELDGKDIADIWQAVDDAVQDHPQWFCTEEPVKPKAFMQDHLRELQEKYPGLEFDKTLKSGELKCSKKDAWKLADAGVNDPLLTAYVNFGHAQKYKSSFTNREYLRSDGRVRCRFGIVESGRFGRFTPRGVSNKKVNCWDTLTGNAEGNQQPIKGSPKAKAMEPGKGSETIPQGSRTKVRSTPSLETEKMI